MMDKFSIEHGHEGVVCLGQDIGYRAAEKRMIYVKIQKSIFIDPEIGFCAPKKSPLYTVGIFCYTALRKRPEEQGQYDPQYFLASPLREDKMS